MGVEAVFLGSKTHEELKTVYASADLFAAPSVTAADGDQEGLGLVMLEAMASGLPVVANDSGGISQVIKNGVNGLLCQEKNVEQLSAAIASVLEDEELYARLSENGMETVWQYDYRAIAEKYKSIICGGNL